FITTADDHAHETDHRRGQPELRGEHLRVLHTDVFRCGGAKLYPLLIAERSFILETNFVAVPRSGDRTHLYSVAKALRLEPLRGPFRALRLVACISLQRTDQERFTF